MGKKYKIKMPNSQYYTFCLNGCSEEATRLTNCLTKAHEEKENILKYENKKLTKRNEALQDTIVRLNKKVKK